MGDQTIEGAALFCTNSMYYVSWEAGKAFGIKNVPPLASRLTFGTPVLTFGTPELSRGLCGPDQRNSDGSLVIVGMRRDQFFPP